MKTLIVLMLFAVVASLFSGLYFVGVDGSTKHRAVIALTVRIVLSVALFAMLLGGSYFGWIGGRL